MSSNDNESKTLDDILVKEEVSYESDESDAPLPSYEDPAPHTRASRAEPIRS